MNNSINLMMPTDIIRQVIAKSNGSLTEAEVVSYLEPFMVKGSITPVEDLSGKPLMAYLTEKVIFLPTASPDEIYAFISLCQQIDDQSMILLRYTEKKLKSSISNIFRRHTRSEHWHNDSNNFIRNGGGKCLDKTNAFKALYNSLNIHYNNSQRCNADYIIHYGLSFTDLSKAYYWFGDSLLKAKVEVSELFGIHKPDVFSFGLRSISEYTRNLDAHLLASYRTLSEQLLPDKLGKSMANPWLSTKCNLGRFYGRISFLVYIATNFSEIICKNARKEIKALMLQFPKITLNYLGMPPNWSNEPLWSNI